MGRIGRRPMSHRKDARWETALRAVPPTLRAYATESRPTPPLRRLKTCATRRRETSCRFFRQFPIFSVSGEMRIRHNHLGRNAI